MSTASARRPGLRVLCRTLPDDWLSSRINFLLGLRPYLGPILGHIERDLSDFHASQEMLYIILILFDISEKEIVTFGVAGGCEGKFS
jgi:hypothetical protein